MSDLLFSQPPGAPSLVFGGEAAPANPTDLVFDTAAPATTALVFGADGAGTAPDATALELVGALPGIGGGLTLRPVALVEMAGALPGLSGVVQMQYRSEAARPLVGQTSTEWQEGRDTRVSTTAPHTEAADITVGTELAWQDAGKIATEVVARFTEADRSVRRAVQTLMQDATRAASHALVGRWQDATFTRNGGAGRWQDARGVRAETGFRHQDATRHRTGGAWDHQKATPVQSHRSAYFKKGTFVERGWTGRYQPGMRPPPGVSAIIPPTPEPCCDVTPHLLFQQGPANSHLIFICDRDLNPPGPTPGETVIVPVRRVYIVLNNATLRRVDGNVEIPTLSMSLSLDRDSWTWGFSAAIPEVARSIIMPDSSGDKVVVEATINGTAYRMLVETIGRERSFGQTAVRIGGRGLSAQLDAPYAPTQSWTNGTARTAQQLMGDVLTLNGVPLDWTVNFGLTDWTVPTGVFTHQGTYISALSAIAGAAGGYLQPHANLQQLQVLPNYPSGPWDWAGVTPDFEIPTAVATRDGVEWKDLPVYNRVFVSGQQAGVLGQITRAGTAGDLIAPMIVDPLITHADAARQRGIGSLAQCGRQMMVSLRMPVLSETGIITPGKFIDYDGQIGLSRAVSVDVSMPEIFQTITVETYA